MTSLASQNFENKTGGASGAGCPGGFSQSSVNWVEPFLKSSEAVLKQEALLLECQSATKAHLLEYQDYIRRPGSNDSTRAATRRDQPLQPHFVEPHPSHCGVAETFPVMASRSVAVFKG